MSVPDGLEGLRFPCECVSSRRRGYSDPWAAISRDKPLPDGTKEQILNLLARELLEERGVLRKPEQHGNGVEWVFWAEEPVADADK
ncbi:MAG: hypothetical protein M3348_17440 [Acidobacteriota bacterium]|nr:hypothetical protein [Acidobacteriota bacterium]